MKPLEVRIREGSLRARIAARWLRSERMALVWGRTLCLHGCSAPEFLGHPAWVRHEICHLAQFRRYGLLPFLILYGWESLRKGYYLNRFEVEARAAETKGACLTVRWRLP